MIRAMIERHVRALIVILVALGIAERTLWNVLRPTTGAAGEAMNVAVAIGSGRGFADAYRLGQGPTAHLMPISPSIAGVVYWLFGVRSPAAEILLASWSIGLAMGTYLLLYSAFRRVGTPTWARLFALAFACLAPVYIGQEAVDFRVWEGGLAMFMTALFLDRLFAGTQTPPGRRAIVGIAALCSGLFFVHPQLGLAAFALAAIFSLQHLPWHRTMLAVAAAATTLALLIVPWALRNERVLGAPILLRSNLGIELALANYDGALDAGNPKQQFLQRLVAIHPIAKAPYDAMIASGGEVAYSRKLESQTTQWMAAHPAKVERLALRHIGQALLPRPWQFDVFGRNLSPALRSALNSIVNFAGFIGVVWATMARRRDWSYLAIWLSAVVLLASPFQPVTRYTYLLYPILLFCAFDLGATLAMRFRGHPIRAYQDNPTGPAVSAYSSGEDRDASLSCGERDVMLRQFQGNNSSSRVAGWSAMRARTSASQPTGRHC